VPDKRAILVQVGSKDKRLAALTTTCRHSYNCLERHLHFRTLSATQYSILAHKSASGDRHPAQMTIVTCAFLKS
jgi:hypothetical protein